MIPLCNCCSKSAMRPTLCHQLPPPPAVQGDLLSELERIPESPLAALPFSAFGSIQNLRDKDVAEIAAVPGMTPLVAEEVYKGFARKIGEKVALKFSSHNKKNQ